MLPLLIGLTLVAQVVVVPGDPRTERVDLFDTHSNRTGYAIVDKKSGRVDTYDTRGNRIGYGQLRGNTIEFFDVRSNRTGTGRLR